MELDLGNLMGYSPSEVDPAALAADPEGHVAELARGMTQALVGRVFELPTSAAPVGRLAALPGLVVVSLAASRPLACPSHTRPSCLSTFSTRRQSLND